MPSCTPSGYCGMALGALRWSPFGFVVMPGLTGTRYGEIVPASAYSSGSQTANLPSTRRTQQPRLTPDLSRLKDFTLFP
jgi:hypothetical protein